MPLKDRSERLSNLVSGLLLASEVGQVLCVSYAECLVAVLEHSTPTIHQTYHERVHPHLTRLAAGLPEYLSPAEAEDVYRQMLSLFERTLTGLVHDAGVRRAIFRTMQIRCQHIQESGLTLEDAAPWIPYLEEYPPYQSLTPPFSYHHLENT